ncbi:MAG: hypothetical protein HY273_07295, partial [Gammaproteobacteria bacterium]|nr:hypothetical protein [Gammaproteobacteria bacterium]
MATENRDLTKATSAFDKPISRLFNPFNEMERILEGFFPRNFARPQHEEWPLMSLEVRVPRIDVV